MTTTMFRASAPQAQTISRLGPLGELPGTWVGSGFNLISLPDKHDNKPFRLKLNATKETLSFRMIGAPIPNRGSVQDDIEFLGVHYFQQVSDAKTHRLLLTRHSQKRASPAWERFRTATRLRRKEISWP